MSKTMIRKPLADGETTEFKFGVFSCVFLVKNLTGGNVYVSFGKDPGNTEEMFLVPAGTWRRHVCKEEDSGKLASTDTVYAVGSGDPGDGLEVECLVW